MVGWSPVRVKHYKSHTITYHGIIATPFAFGRCQGYFTQRSHTSVPARIKYPATISRVWRVAAIFPQGCHGGHIKIGAILFAVFLYHILLTPRNDCLTRPVAPGIYTTCANLFEFSLHLVSRHANICYCLEDSVGFEPTCASRI